MSFSLILLSGAIHGWRRFKLPFEVLPEARDIAIADSLGDAGDGQAGAAEKLGGYVEAEFLQVGLEAKAVMLAEETREIASASEGDGRGDFGEAQRTMHAEGEMSGGSLQWVGFLSGGVALLFGESEPHGLHVTAGGVFGSGGIAESDGFDEVLVFITQEASVGEAFVEGIAVKLLQDRKSVV